MQRYVPGDDSRNTPDGEVRGVQNMGVGGKEATILDVQRDASNLTLRLDADSWSHSGPVAEQPVITLLLTGCEDMEHSWDVLQQASSLSIIN